jgi:hypothetical protein
MMVVMDLPRGATSPGKKSEEDEPESAQLHPDEIRDEDERAGAKHVLNLNRWKARAMRTFRGRKRPGEGD